MGKMLQYIWTLSMSKATLNILLQLVLLFVSGSQNLTENWFSHFNFQNTLLMVLDILAMIGVSKKTLIELSLFLRYRNVFRNSFPTEFLKPYFKAISDHKNECPDVYLLWTWNSFSLRLLKLIHGKLAMCWQCKFSLSQLST